MFFITVTRHLLFSTSVTEELVSGKQPLSGTFQSGLLHTCPHSIAGLVDCHLPGHVQQDLSLRTCLDVSCWHHGCGDNTGTPGHAISLELLGRPSCSGRTDHSHPSTCLTSSRHRDFSLGSICHGPAKTETETESPNPSAKWGREELKARKMTQGFKIEHFKEWMELFLQNIRITNSK